MKAITAHDLQRDHALAANRDAILQWVRDHRLEPNDVWSINTWGPFVLAYAYPTDEDGNKQIRGDEVRMRLCVRWLRRPFPVKETT